MSSRTAAAGQSTSLAPRTPHPTPLATSHTWCPASGELPRPVRLCFVESQNQLSLFSLHFRPSTVAVESCPSRLSLFLAKDTSAALWLFDTVYVAGVADIPGHPTPSELTARLATLAGQLVSDASAAADAQALLSTGLFDDVAVEVVQPRFYGLSSALQPVGRAQALRFVTTPRRLVGDFDRYVVAIAPELTGYDAAYAPQDGSDDSRRPHVPWLPAFHAAFQALHDVDTQDPLHLCCLVRHAVCVAGSEHVPPAKPIAIRFEQDDEAAPDALIVGIDVPDKDALARMRHLPADARPYDVWRAATEDAFALQTDRDTTTNVANDARLALAVPPPVPERRRRPHAAHRQAAQCALLDAVLGQIALLPFELLSAVAAWRLRVAPGDDLRSAVTSAVRCDARRIVLVDRPVRATVRRAGTALRRLLSAVCITGALLAVGLACIHGSMPSMQAIGQAFACSLALAAALMCAAVAALAVVPTPLIARLMTPPKEVPAHAPAALMTERDACMVSHLRSFATTGRTLAHASQLVRTVHGSSIVYVLTRGASDAASEESGCTVAVVGAAHLPGILAKWLAGGMTAVDA